MLKAGSVSTISRLFGRSPRNLTKSLPKKLDIGTFIAKMRSCESMPKKNFKQLVFHTQFQVFDCAIPPYSIINFLLEYFFFYKS